MLVAALPLSAGLWRMSRYWTWAGANIGDLTRRIRGGPWSADLHNPAHFASLVVGRCPSNRLKFITRKNCLWVLSPQLGTGKPLGCLAFPTRHLEASSSDRDLNLVSMHVDH